MGSVRLYGATSGYLELQAPDVAPDSTLVLPSDSLQPGLVHLHTETFSAQSAVSIDDVFDATYDNYQVVFAGVYGTGCDIRFRFRSSGTDDTTASSYKSLYNIWGGGSNYAFGTQTDSYARTIYVDGTRYYSSHIEVIKPFTSNKSELVGIGTTGNYGYANSLISADHNQVKSNDGFTILASTGTITGTIRIYGYRNS